MSIPFKPAQLMGAMLLLSLGSNAVSAVEKVSTSANKLEVSASESWETANRTHRAAFEKALRDVLAKKSLEAQSQVSPSRGTPKNPMQLSNPDSALRGMDRVHQLERVNAPPLLYYGAGPQGHS